MSLPRFCDLAIVTIGVTLALSLTVSRADARQSTKAETTLAGTAAVAGTAVVGGRVINASGAAMPGVAVDLYAWPTDAVLRTLKPGHLVPTTMLATATTSSVGTFMLRVPAAKLKAAAVESGYANLEIFSAVGGIWFLSYPTDSLPVRPATPATVNFSDKSKLPCGIDPEGQPYSFTGFAKERDRKPAWAVVGQGYVAPQKKTVGDFMQFEYDEAPSHTQNSALGIGISGYGFDAGYNNAGSNTSTATGSETYPNARQSMWFRTMFSVGQFRGLCYGPSNDSRIPRQKQHGKCPRKFTNLQNVTFYVHKCIWMIKSTGWFGGASSVHPRAIPHSPARFCAPQEANTTFETSKERSIQWSGGFELGASLGVKGADLNASFSSSAQTGYDANAVMQFHFKHSGFACGTDKVAPMSAIVVMRGKA
jgi:hypothetical protein